MRTRAWWTGLVAVCVLVLVGVAPAQAHSSLVSSDPQDGALLAEAPTDLSFTFNEDLLAQGNAITLTELGSDTRLDLGQAEVDGPTVTVAWPAQSPAGEFRAAYRVVSADGHPIEGAITFTVQQAAGGGDDPVAASPTAVASASPTAAGDASPQPLSAPDREAGAGLLAWIIGLGIVILLGVGAGAWFMRRAR